MTNKTMTTEDKIAVLSSHVRLLRKLLIAQRGGGFAPMASSESMASAMKTSAIPSRPKVVDVVIATLKDAQIMNNAQENTQLTERFNQVQSEDEKLGHPGFRIGAFLDLLHGRCPWNWAIAPSELLSGLLATPGEIADRILATA